MFPDFDFNIFIDLFGHRQPRPPPDDQDAAKFPDPSTLGALPFPQPTPAPPPTQLPGTPPPIQDFPRAPGSNDPIFRGPIFGRLFGLGGVLIALEILILNEIEKRQDKRLNDIIRDQDRAIAEAAAQRAADKADREAALRVEKRVRGLLGAPETFDPTPQIEPPRPDISPGQSEAIVLFPAGFPGLPDAIGDPGFGRDPLEFPEIPPPRVGFPFPVPTPIPLPAPLGFPIPIPPPVEVPFVDPLTLFDPLPVPSGGVPDNVPVLGSAFDPSAGFQPNPFANPQLNPERCPQRRCDEDLDDPRIECFKGLYKEGRFDTGFTSWVPIDCDTGRELSDNVIPFGR